MNAWMHKVICERPRYGGDDPRGWNKGIPLDELPHHESMTERYSKAGERKSFNEFLAPLYRFIHKSVGRRWDDVFSEICSGIKLDSTVQRHVREHVDGYIETNTFIGSDGKVWVHSKYGGGDRCIEEPAYRYYRYEELYVHPITGILTTVVHKAKPKPQEPIRHIIVSRDMHLAEVDGFWNRLEIREVPAGIIEYFTAHRQRDEIVQPLRLHIPYDVYLKASLSDIITKASYIDRTRHWPRLSNWKRDDLKRIYGRPDVYAHSMEQANGREMKKHGLKNAA